uniref:Peptidase M10 metallopeptidase domain-containing protein n=1 Tax=uncultured Elusimicrobia bacterium TaxID=699876 RepID=A0A650EM41_9BACT|nr:hypothetical protein Elusimicrob1349_1460 [uncultured Elusimicrobia bacterium]
MKKLIALAFALITAAGAAAEPMARLVSYNVNRPRYMAPKLAKGETVTYCTYLSESGRHVTNPEDFDKTVRLAIKLWTVYPAYLIRQAGREKEFAPVLKALAQTPRLTRLPACDFSRFGKEHLKVLNPPPAKTSVQTADVSYFFEDVFFAKLNNLEKIPSYFTLNPIPHVLITSQARQNHAFAATWEDNPAGKSARFNALREQILNTPNADYQTMDKLLEDLSALLKDFGYSYRTLLYTVLHETGHAVGLADQHKWINNDQLYTTVDTRKSVMDYSTTFLTCDDADGVITLIDDALGIKRNFDSLCQDGISFSGGKESFKGTKTSTTQTKDLFSSYTYQEDTNETGILDWEEKLYVHLAEDSAKYINKLFDLSLMPEKWGGYQTAKGKLKFVDMEDASKGKYPIGEHFTRLTIGPGTLYKQTLVEHYDNAGNLLDYTLTIYNTDTDTVSETRHVKVKK